MKAGSMPERLLIGPGSPPSIDAVYPELSPPPEPCLILEDYIASRGLVNGNTTDGSVFLEIDIMKWILN
jgi:hypothetical protein